MALYCSIVYCKSARIVAFYVLYVNKFNFKYNVAINNIMLLCKTLELELFSSLSMRIDSPPLVTGHKMVNYRDFQLIVKSNSCTVCFDILRLLSKTPTTFSTNQKQNQNQLCLML